MKLFRQIDLRLAILALILCGCPYVTTAQQADPKQPIQITGDDFPRTRDISDINEGKSVFVWKKKPIYRLRPTRPRVRHIPAKTVVAKTPTSKSSFKLPTDTKSAEVWRQIGVTIWRMEPETKSTSGDKVTARMLVQESGASKAYTPKRVAADTVFNLGDKVRLSFESPAAGYLYVFDREMYADGKVGEPYQIFPTMLSRGGNNRIDAGSVIDIPAQTDRSPFFEMKSSDPNWRGELLTVIVSPEPLTDIGMPDKPSPVSAALVAALEDKYLKPAGEYEQNGTAGQSYTKTEKEAGGIGTRQLTQDDPFPQTVYRVKTRTKEPMLINLNLSVKDK